MLDPHRLFSRKVDLKEIDFLRDIGLEVLKGQWDEWNRCRVVMEGQPKGARVAVTVKLRNEKRSGPRRANHFAFDHNGTPATPGVELVVPVR